MIYFELIVLEQYCEFQFENLYFFYSNRNSLDLQDKLNFCEIIVIQVCSILK